MTDAGIIEGAMTPERKAEIHDEIYSERHIPVDMAEELLTEVSRLEAEIARYREEPGEDVVEMVASTINAHPPALGGVVTHKAARAAIRAYQEAMQ